MMMYHKKRTKKGNSLILMLIVLIGDQLTKELVLSHVSYGEVVHVTNFFNIVLTFNHGITFGMLKAYSDIHFYILFSAIVTIMVLVFWGWIKAENHLQRYTTAMIMAGALGNLCDRIRFRAVVDFLDFHINQWHWYAFNIADSAIVCGVIILMFDSYLSSKKQRFSKSLFKISY
jgi:signal peptidase II